jgi:hypothetical protein
MKVDAVLVEWVFQYARRHQTTLTRLVEAHFKTLREIENQRMQEDADQV